MTILLYTRFNSLFILFIYKLQRLSVFQLGAFFCCSARFAQKHCIKDYALNSSTQNVLSKILLYSYFLFSIKVNYSNFLFECILIEKEAAQVRQSHPKSYGKNVFGFWIEEEESKRALATLFRLRTWIGCIYIFFFFWFVSLTSRRFQSENSDKNTSHKCMRSRNAHRSIWWYTVTGHMHIDILLVHVKKEKSMWSMKHLLPNNYGSTEI